MDVYQKLFENIPDGVVIIQEGVCKLTNPGLLKMIGYSKEQVLGKSLYLFFTQESQHLLQKFFESESADEKLPAHVSARIKTNNGETRDVDIHSIQIEYNGLPAKEIIIRDNTEFKRLEKALFESTEKYKDLLDSMHDILFELDNQGKFKYISPQVENLTGFKPLEILGQHIGSFIHPDDINGLQMGFECNLDGKIEPRAFRHKKKEGDWIFLQMTSHVRLRHGKPDGIIGVMNDVTQRKRVEAALRNSEEYFRTVMENISDPILVLKEDGCIQYATPSITKVIGCSVDDIIHEKLFKYIHPASYFQATGFFVDISSKPDNTTQIELHFNHRDGSIHKAQVIGKNALDNPSVCGIILNIHAFTSDK
jgi:PAS domain S-box-containing protein